VAVVCAGIAAIAAVAGLARFGGVSVCQMDVDESTERQVSDL
jgi:NAD/NADP transhydrogenase alpha subunit